MLSAYLGVVASVSFFHVHARVPSLEDFGFRIAWIAAAHMPVVFVLAVRLNPIPLLIGASTEQLNWIHRLVIQGFLSSCQPFTDYSSLLLG